MGFASRASLANVSRATASRRQPLPPHNKSSWPRGGRRNTSPTSPLLRRWPTTRERLAAPDGRTALLAPLAGRRGGAGRADGSIINHAVALHNGSAGRKAAARCLSRRPAPRPAPPHRVVPKWGGPRRPRRPWRRCRRRAARLNRGVPCVCRLSARRARRARAQRVTSGARKGLPPARHAKGRKMHPLPPSYPLQPGRCRGRLYGQRFRPISWPPRRWAGLAMAEAWRSVNTAGSALPIASIESVARPPSASESAAAAARAPVGVRVGHALGSCALQRQCCLPSGRPAWWAAGRPQRAAWRRGVGPRGPIRYHRRVPLMSGRNAAMPRCTDSRSCLVLLLRR